MKRNDFPPIKRPSEVLVPYVLSYKRFNNPDLFYMDPLSNEFYYISQALLMLDWGGFGEADMKMPRWVFYDCAMMPGLIAGYGVRGEDADTDIKNYFNMQLPFYPCAMSIMIPMMEKNTFFAHNLVSINAMIPGKFKTIARYSKALNLQLGGVRVLYGATQWNSPSMFIHLRFGEMEIVSAYSRLHGEKYTLTYRLNISKDPWKFRELGSKGANLRVGIEDEEVHKEINEELVKGRAKYFILHREEDYLLLRREELD